MSSPWLQSETPQNAHCYQHFLPCSVRNPVWSQQIWIPAPGPNVSCELFGWHTSLSEVCQFVIIGWFLGTRNSPIVILPPMWAASSTPEVSRSAAVDVRVWNHNNSAETLERWVKFIALPLPVSLEFGSWSTETSRSWLPVVSLPWCRLGVESLNEWWLWAQPLSVFRCIQH